MKWLANLWRSLFPERVIREVVYIPSRTKAAYRRYDAKRNDKIASLIEDCIEDPDAKAEMLKTLVVAPAVRKALGA